MIDAQIYALETPSYIYDENKLLNVVSRTKEILGDKFDLCYSMKANPFMVKYIEKLVDRIEVCSHGEFRICAESGIDPDKILYTGLNKQEMEILEAAQYGVRYFNVESLNNLNMILNVAISQKTVLKLYIRITSGNQFGVDEEGVKAVYDVIRQSRYLELAGIHFFAGTAVAEKKREGHLRYLVKFISDFKKHTGIRDIEVEYGPGLPVRYFEDEESGIAENSIENMSNTLVKLIPSNGQKWTIELGRYLVAECGSYLTEVVDIKNNNDINYAIVDGGINHLIYYGQTMALRIPIMNTSSDEKDIEEYWVCGSLCTTADVLVKNASLRRISIGDKILFDNCGAYSGTEACYMFLSRDMPKVYIKRANGEIQLVRDSIATYQFNNSIGRNYNEKSD